MRGSQYLSWLPSYLCVFYSFGNWTISCTMRSTFSGNRTPSVKNKHQDKLSAQWKEVSPRTRRSNSRTYHELYLYRLVHEEKYFTLYNSTWSTATAVPGPVLNCRHWALYVNTAVSYVYQQVLCRSLLLQVTHNFPMSINPGKDSRHCMEFISFTWTQSLAQSSHWAIVWHVVGPEANSFKKADAPLVENKAQ